FLGKFFPVGPNILFDFHLDDLATGGFNRCTGTGSNAQAFQRQRLGHFARQHHLHTTDNAGDQVCFTKRLQINDFCSQVYQLAGADFRSNTTNTGRETVLRQTTLQRHLPDLETCTHCSAAARLLTLVTSTGSLAEATTDTTANATTRFGAAWCRAQCIQMHDLLLAFNSQHVTNLSDHSTNGRRILKFNRLVHAAQSKSFESLSVSFLLANGAANQRDLYLFCSHSC